MILYMSKFWKFWDIFHFPFRVEVQGVAYSWTKLYWKLCRQNFELVLSVTKIQSKGLEVLFTSGAWQNWWNPVYYEISVQNVPHEIEDSGGYNSSFTLQIYWVTTESSNDSSQILPHIAEVDANDENSWTPGRAFVPVFEHSVIPESLSFLEPTLRRKKSHWWKSLLFLATLNLTGTSSWKNPRILVLF